MDRQNAMLVLAVAALAGAACKESEPERDCQPGETQMVGHACGPCSTGTLRQRCSDRFVWEDVACDDPFDIDGDTVPSTSCADRSGGCCTEAMDCNDQSAGVHPATYECTYNMPPESEACTTTCGTDGTRACGPECSWLECTVALDECDGVDIDCDGETDEDAGCAEGTTVACTTTCGSTGSGVCGEGCTMPVGEECDPPAEVCNGSDDDCDGVTDNDLPCLPGATVACTTECDSEGTGACTAECTPPTGDDCTPPAEACNGEDDDCDTEADNGFDCAAGAVVACTTTCDSAGTGECSAECEPPAAADCTPPVERCGNTADDDCDTETDETDPEQCTPGETVACTTACGTTGGGECTAECVEPAPADCAAVPVCLNVGEPSEGWFDPCTEDVLLVVACDGCTAACDQVGMAGEGWYSSCGGLIAAANCG